MGLRKKLAVIAAVVVLGAGPALAIGMPVIDPTAIMTQIANFSKTMQEYKRRFMEAKEKAVRLLKAAQAMSKGDYRSFFQGGREFANALKAYTAKAPFFNKMLDQSVTDADVILKLCDDYDNIAGFFEKGGMDELRKKWEGLANNVVKAWDNLENIDSFSGFLSGQIDAIEANTAFLTAGWDDLTGSFTDVMEDAYDLVKLGADASNTFKSWEDFRNSSRMRVAELQKELSALYDEIESLDAEIVGMMAQDPMPAELEQKKEEMKTKMRRAEHIERSLRETLAVNEKVDGAHRKRVAGEAAQLKRLDEEKNELVFKLKGSARYSDFESDVESLAKRHEPARWVSKPRPQKSVKFSTIYGVPALEGDPASDEIYGDYREDVAAPPDPGFFHWELD